MVITCPNCEAKYKLPGEKLKGRGAKITCPRCAHVFVIFNQEAEKATESDLEVEAAPADDGPDEPSQGRQATPPGPHAGTRPAGSGPLAGGPLPGGLKAEDIFTSDYGGVDFDVDQSRKVPPKKTAQVEPPSGSEQVRASAAGGSLAAENLDFKAVGVGTWKVKVAIGLIYDFPDIKTLRKSIRENKVTLDDQISHDGKDWTRIGNDAEQEVYFAEVHARLMDETGGKLAEEKPKRKAPVVDATSSTSIEPSRLPGGEAHGDAFKVDLKQRPSRAAQRRRNKKSEERTILGLNPTMVGVGVAAIAVIGLIITLGSSRGLFGGDNEDQPTSRVTEEQMVALAEAAREKIEQDLQHGTEQILSEQPDGGSSDEFEEPESDGYAHRRNPDGSFDDTGLEPVIPEIDESTPAPPVADREEPTPREEPTDTSDREDPTAAVSESTADSTVEETTADDWFMLGDMAMAGGNCSGAIPHLQKAVSMQGGNSSFNYKLGLAFHQCGRDAEALGPLKKAAPSIGAAQDLVNQIEGGGGE